MINWVSKGLLIAAFLMFLLVPGSYADEANGVKKRVDIAVLPCTDPVMTFKMFHRLITYLEQETGFVIKLVVPRNNAEFERGIRNQDIEFALQDPHTYVRLANFYNRGALVRALNPDGTATQSALVVVRKGRGINKLEELRGKTVMFGPKLSAHKWLAGRLLFEENGINIDRDLKAYSHGGCCEDIGFNVYVKKFDAGLVCDHFFEGHARREPPLGMDLTQLVVISRTRSIPTRVFAARQDISEAVVAAVNQALLRLNRQKPPHAVILGRAEIGGFQKSSDRIYDGIRMLLIDKQTAE